MLSLRRLGYVLLIVLGICSIFVLYNINEKNSKSIAVSNQIITEQELLVSPGISGDQNGTHFYVVGNDEKEVYRDIYKNVCRLMEDLKVSWSIAETIEEEDLQDSNAIFIFCDDVVSSYIDLPLMAEFVQDGGKMVLAAGIAEGYQDIYLQPMLGIVEKTIKGEYDQFRVAKDFFPLQDDVMTYDGFNASTWMDVKTEAEIFVEDNEKEIPIVYTYPYGAGETLVINATFLNDSRCVGVLTAGLGELLDEFIYPVLGAECVFLDNFPMVTYVNDSVCMKLYGRTTEAFVRDIVWPVFQGIAVRNELKYTSSVLSVAEKPDVFPAISESLFNTLGKSALQYNGEMVYAADCPDAEELYLNNDFIQKFDETFKNYHIEALVMVNGEAVPEAVEALGRDMKAIRGKLSSDQEHGRMAALEDYVVFPEATRGINLDEGNMFAIASVLSSHGMVSHTFDVNRFIVEDENVAGWDQDKKQLAEYEQRVFSKTDYLQKVSLSETTNILKSYLGMEYGWEKNENVITISANHVIEGQPFWLRTKGKIVKAEGAEYIKISDGYYCVRLNETSAKLILE